MDSSSPERKRQKMGEHIQEKTSYGNSSECQITHMSLNWTANFTDHCLQGSVLLSLSLKPNVKNVILDTRKLTIHSIQLIDSSSSSAPHSHPLTYTLGEEDPAFGAPLKIQVPETVTGECVLAVEYRTAKGDDCSALQWLPPEQTAEKKHPFMFSQCQAIHARSLVPCMDAPGLKFTYDAVVSVAAPMRALMSAVGTGVFFDKTEGGTTWMKYTWQQKIPIPSYLLAIGCGWLAAKEIGPRSTLYAEPSMVEEGAREFEDTEKFLSTAEELLTPYEWGRYDLLLLPPSFPYGGMENPCLTFITPTLLAGDKSLAGVVAHEIAHSWSGNLVTNATWDYFWMNEGFTVFIERKILARTMQNEKAGFHLKAILGYNGLEDTVESFGAGHKFTCLNIDHKGIDPDDAFSRVPYEKGFNFLCYLQETVGGAEVFEPFLKVYVNKFRLGTVTPTKFRDLFESYMKSANVPHASLSKIDWNGWLNTPGMPLVKPTFDDSLYKGAEKMGKGWLDSTTQVSGGELNGWTTDQIVLALTTARKAVVKGEGKVDCSLLDKAYSFTTKKNSEIKFAWLILCIDSGYKEVVDEIVAFVTSLGRMKFVRPIYKQLFAGDSDFKALAVDTFTKHRQSYHSICQKMVARDLKIND